MKYKLYTIFAGVGIAAALVAIARLALGHDIQQVIHLNIAIGIVCLVMMVLLSYKERRKIERRN